MARKKNENKERLIGKLIREHDIKTAVDIKEVLKALPDSTLERNSRKIIFNNIDLTKWLCYN